VGRKGKRNHERRQNHQWMIFFFCGVCVVTCRVKMNTGVSEDGGIKQGDCVLRICFVSV